MVMRLPWRRAPSLLIAVLIAAGGCGSMDRNEAAPSPLAASRWVARAIDGEPVAEGVESTLTFAEGGRVAGSTGCNRYTGQATIDGAALTFGPIATTRMACPPPRMDEERRFSAALQATAGWRIEDGELVLVDAAGEPRLRLAPLTAPAAP